MGKKSKRVCGYCRYKYPDDMLDAHQRVIHGIDASNTDSTGQLDTQEGGAEGTWFHCDEDECVFKTASKSYLKMHKMVTHGTEETWYHCNECVFKTAYVIELKRHKTAKHGAEGTWLHCDECHYKTPHNGDLTIHKERVHKI